MADKRQSFCLLFLLFVNLFSATSSHASSMLLFGSVENIEPVSFKKDNVVQGFYIDVFSEIAKRADFKVNYRLYPFKRLDRYLKAGEIDGTLTIFYRKEREAYLHYSLQPMITSQIRVFVKKGKEFPLKSFRDLYGKEVGIIAGWTIKNEEYNKALTNEWFSVQSVNKYEQNLKKLMANKIDCFIMTEQMTWFHANRLGVEYQLSELDFYIDHVSSYIAVSKKSKHIKHPEEFLKKVDQAFETIKSDGTYDRLLKRYNLKNLIQSP